MLKIIEIEFFFNLKMRMLSNYFLKLIELLGKNKRKAILLLVVLPVVIELPMILKPQAFLKTIKRPGNEASIYPIDTEMYANYVQFFRGLKQKGDGISVPYTYRPLAPLLASFLPIQSPIYSLIVLNLIFLYATMLLIYLTSRALDFNFGSGILSSMLYVISFPVFYFSPLGLVDSVCLFFICLGIYSVIREKFWLFGLSLLLGIYTKESILVLLPFALIYFYQKYCWGKKLYYLSSISILLIVVNFYIIRNYFAFNTSFYWNIEIDAFWANLFRMGTNIGSLLSFGIVGVVSTIFILGNLKKLKNEYLYLLPWLAGFLSSIGLYGYAYFSAFADGRFVWYIYPFAIPLTLYYINEQKKSSKPL